MPVIARGNTPPMNTVALSPAFPKAVDTKPSAWLMSLSVLACAACSASVWSSLALGCASCTALIASAFTILTIQLTQSLVLKSTEI